MLKFIVLGLALSLTAPTAFGQNKPLQTPDALTIDSACATESKAAGCGNEKVGTGLLKCMFHYKKTHKDFSYSPACQNAIAKARQDRKNK